MRRYDIWMSEGRVEPAIPGAREPRRLDLIGVEADDEQDALAKLRTEWRAQRGDELATPLIGISRAY